MSYIGRPKGSFNAEYNRKRCIKMYRDKYSQSEIAEKLGITQPLVSRYLRECREEWRKERLEAIEEVLQSELESLDDMEKMTAEIFNKFNDLESDSDIFAASDVALKAMATRLKITEQRQKLLGLNKAIKLDIKSENKNTNVQESKEVRDEILSRLTPKNE